MKFKFKKVFGLGFPQLVVKIVRGAVKEVFDIEKETIYSDISFRTKMIKEEVRNEVDEILLDIKKDIRNVSDNLDVKKIVKELEDEMTSKLSQTVEAPLSSSKKVKKKKK